MNIFKKMQEARCRLQALSLKKTGQNKFAGYSYYELGDILPAINNINKDLGLCTHVTFDNDFATLTVIDSDVEHSEVSRPVAITFTSPMSKATLKGAHDIQNLGAVETYQRRYLYMSAYEIVEHDAVDSSKGKEPKKELTPTNLQHYIEQLELCETVDGLKELWASATENNLPNKTFQDACADRKKVIEAGKNEVS